MVVDYCYGVFVDGYVFVEDLGGEFCEYVVGIVLLVVVVGYVVFGDDFVE